MFFWIKSNLCEIGLVLVFLSTSLAQVVRLFTEKDNSLSSILMILSLIMMKSKNKIKMNKAMLLLIAYQMYVLFIAFFAGKGIFESNGMIYTLFVIAMAVVLCTVREIKGDGLVSSMWLISGMANIFLSLYFVMNDMEHINGVYSGDVLIADRTTLSTLAYMHVIAALVYIPKAKKDKAFKTFFMVCAFYNIVITMRRGMFITLIIILILNVYLGTGVKINSNKLLRNLFIVVAIVLICTQIPYVSEQLDKMIDSVQSALNSFMGKGTQDLSTTMRSDSRTRILNDMNQFTFANWVFGKGYNAGWIDFPFLQAFYDMGIVGGIIYIIAQTYLPFRFFFIKRKNMERYQKMLFYLYIITLSNNFYSGTPYGIIKYMFVLPFYMDWAVEVQNTPHK